MDAKEAIRIATEMSNETNSKILKDVEKDIVNSANKGDLYLNYYKTLNGHVIKVLEDRGFKVKYAEDYPHDYFHKISW